jgi:glycosyltransferase involved in cell wall biosynthesis
MLRTPRGEKAENLNISLADISVIIPAFNRANLIGETLRSLLNQTVPAKEI